MKSLIVIKMEFSLLLEQIRGEKKMWRKKFSTPERGFPTHTRAPLRRLLHTQTPTTEREENKIKKEKKCDESNENVLFGFAKARRYVMMTHGTVRHRNRWCHSERKEAIARRRRLRQFPFPDKCKIYERKPWMLVSRDYDKFSSPCALHTWRLFSSQGKKRAASIYDKLFSIDWVTSIVKSSVERLQVSIISIQKSLTNKFNIQESVPCLCVAWVISES